MLLHVVLHIWLCCVCLSCCHAVRKGVQQVIEWLQEAESDEVSDGDDDEEDDE